MLMCKKPVVGRACGKLEKRAMIILWISFKQFIIASTKKLRFIAQVSFINSNWKKLATLRVTNGQGLPLPSTTIMTLPLFFEAIVGGSKA